MSDQSTTQKNKTTATIAGIVAVSMVLLSIFAVPPAYRLFCQITGWGGTTQRAEAAPAHVLERKITVRFDANIAPGLPWHFKPEQLHQTIQVGQSSLAFYQSENLSGKPVSGQATFNVSPAKAGIYFRKIDCFCFTEQTLQPGEKVSMPVAYFIDPAIDKDHNLDEVETITLSYTFFRLDEEGLPVSAALDVPAKPAAQ